MANKFIAPVILKLLNDYKAGDMTFAINNNVNLAQGLEEDAKYLGTIRMLTVGVPFVNKFGDAIKKKKWIMWFLNGPMKKKRPDLFNTICYTPGGIKYIIRQIRKLVAVIFD